MDAIEKSKRDEVVKEALSWIGTPYHHRGSVKGIGADCAMMPYMVYRKTVLIPEIEIENYPHDWHLNREAERYLKYLTDHGTEVETPLPGDFVIFQFGRCFSHGAVVINWPVVVHAFIKIGTILEDVEKAGWLNKTSEGTGLEKYRPRKFFTLWSKQ